MHLWRHQSKAEGVIKYRLFKKHFTDQITHYSHIVTLSPAMENSLRLIKCSGDIEDDCNHPFISIIYTPAYTEGCTCLVTKSIVLQNSGQLLLTDEHNKRGEKQSLVGVCTCKQQSSTKISIIQNILVSWIRYNFFFCPSKPCFQIVSLNQSEEKSFDCTSSLVIGVNSMQIIIITGKLVLLWPTWEQFYSHLFTIWSFPTGVQ